jgi:AcrR family transcriptional regulator
MYGQATKQELDVARAGNRARGHGGTSEAESTILDAGERLLETVPLHELSVARVINEAGVSRATFYFYFSSKFAVLTALVARAVDEIYAAIQPYLDDSPGVSLETRLRRRIAASAEVWKAHRSVLRATSENWDAYPELRTLWLDVIERLTEGIASEIDHERASGQAAPGTDSRQLAATLVWAIERCLYVAGLGVHDYLSDEQETVAVITSMWIAAVYGDGRATDGSPA